jgi:hypothetical protein
VIGGAGGNQDGTTGSGVLGTGSSGTTQPSGGGGGGYYGGAAGSSGGGGGGGSGFTPDTTGMTNGVRSGNGQVNITYDAAAGTCSKHDDDDDDPGDHTQATAPVATALIADARFTG